MSIRLAENADRRQMEGRFELLKMMDGKVPEVVPALRDEGPPPTMFEGSILPPTFVSPTRGISSYEMSLMEMGMFEEVFEPRRRRHCELESAARDAISRDEEGQHKHLLAICTRSLRTLVDAIHQLPQEMIELQLCKLHDHERLEFRLRPAVRGEQVRRDFLQVLEVEERMRARHQFIEDRSFRQLVTRCRDLMASIVAFMKAQAVIRLGLDSQSGIEHTYFTKWKNFAAFIIRRRRIHIGLRRLYLQVNKNMLQRYCHYWNGPGQQALFHQQRQERCSEERELRGELILSEEEVRGRSIYEAMEKTEFQSLFDEHFDEYDPLLRERKRQASEELEMLNAARHAKWRLLCLYKFKVRVQGETKAAYLLALSHQYTSNRRLMCWKHWTERTTLSRNLIREHRSTTLELREETRRNTLVLLQIHLRQRLVTKALTRPVSIREVREVEERANLARQRHRYTSWLFFISKNNPHAESAILESQTVTKLRHRFFTKLVRFRRRRRDASAALVVRWTRGANLIVLQVEELFARMALEARQELFPLQHRHIHLRKPHIDEKTLPNFNIHLLRQRFRTLMAFKVRQQHRHNALKVTHIHAVQLVVGRYMTNWDLFATPRTAIKVLGDELQREQATFAALQAKFRSETDSLVAEEKYQQATTLLTITNSRLRAYALRRLGALVARRKVARSKTALAVAMANQLEQANVARRYIVVWRKVCTRRRMALVVAQSGLVCNIELMRRYFALLRPPTIRRSKVCRAKKNLQAAREAAESAATSYPSHSRTAAGELTHAVLPLRRRARLLPPL